MQPSPSNSEREKGKGASHDAGIPCHVDNGRATAGTKRSFEGDAVAVGDEDDGDDSEGRLGGANATVAIADVAGKIGIEVYKFLHPRDLLSFSLANRRLFEEVSKGLIQACMRQLPPNFGSAGVDHRITFAGRHTFSRREDLLDHLLEKVRSAELKLAGEEYESMDESLMRARELLRDKPGARFVSYSDLPDVSEHLRREYTSAGCHYDGDNRALASSRSSYILSRMEDASERDVSTVRTWMSYILSQRHVVAGTWFWSCRHRNLDFRGVEGKGVMISSPSAEGEEMEIRWTRLTASRV